jgi:hypothetical protein
MVLGLRAVALGWSAAGRWGDAWTEFTRLMSAQWPSGMVPHIVFWHDDKSYFPGPEVWATGRTPPSSGLTQPPLPASEAARLFAADPDRERAVASLLPLKTLNTASDLYSVGDSGRWARAVGM